MALPTPPPDIARVAAQRAVAGTFFLFGLCIGLWFVHIPILAARLDLTPSTIGLALLCTGLGSLLFQPVAALLIGRIGSGPAARIFLALFVLLVILPVNAPSIFLLFLFSPLLGMVAGSLNVAVNTQGSLVESVLGRPIMPFFHGCFSLGVLTASALGSGLIAAGLKNGGAVILVSCVVFLPALLITRGFVPHNRNGEPPTKRGPRFAMPVGALLGIAGMAFLANTVEFTVNDWSALFLIEEKGASASTAAVGLGAFALASTVMRFAGSRLVLRLGTRRVLSLGGALVTLGAALAVLAPFPLLAACGFLVIGIGVANCVPVLMSEASHVSGVRPEIGVAATTTALTSGILLGPPFLGFVAEWTSLTVSIGVSCLSGLIILYGALRKDWHHGPKVHE